jgi:hypothetical protein
MDQCLRWLPDAADTPWEPLGNALRNGLSVPNGFIVMPTTPEQDIRAAYEDLKVREKTHFLAVRGPSHAVLNVIGPDTLIHTLRRFWAENAIAAVLVQRMIPAIWSGNAQWHRRNLRIKANEGMMMLDPDTYLVNAVTRRGTRRSLEPRQRKMIRHVDGSSRVVEREGERSPMPPECLAAISELASKVGADISWAIDDREKTWLISVITRS